MCHLHQALSKRAEVMLPGESLSLTRESLLALLAQAEPEQIAATLPNPALCGSVGGTGGPTRPLQTLASWTTEELAKYLGIAPSSFRGYISRGALGPKTLFRRSGTRGYRIPGSTAEAIDRHLRGGGDLSDFLEPPASTASQRVGDLAAAVAPKPTVAASEKSGNAFDNSEPTDGAPAPDAHVERPTPNARAKGAARKPLATPSVVRIDSWRSVFEDKAQPARRSLR